MVQTVQSGGAAGAVPAVVGSLCSCSDKVESRAQWKCLRFFAPFEDFPVAPETVFAQFKLCIFLMGQA